MINAKKTIWFSMVVMLALSAGMIVCRTCSEDTLPVDGGRMDQRPDDRFPSRRIKEVKPDAEQVGTSAPVDDEMSAGEPIPEEALFKTEAEMNYEAWESVFGTLVKWQNVNQKPPSKKQVLEFKKAFDKLSAEARMENIPHAQNLFSDISISYLTEILYDVNEPKDVLESIYHDIMNRPEELKMPIFRKIAANEKHPLSEEALDILIAVDDPAVK